ncbi:hypothetical protein LTR35_017664 [Friedmanniomyces endolithicus]|uniref:Xylanolytic transcriptional activator regulatory domain-containing protein n=1 Tax=Friedmanniomyces endolithicus TaxID=329885 RepID=A0AAN6F568_9PEZI|nr:hypothetical protein LTR35_017664 [Friedmanniomyces endolithicus]KAK0268358.1 hypothetical protein LTS00_017591 [Friedmanniomyces endolithicus]KAK0302856.1 hypothetical protein LTR82_017734 [Friedmanniomyces endolithicus]KAK0971799.1 hypothetical protein LTR54_017709 [Friedmanniomyces endolithicus]
MSARTRVKGPSRASHVEGGSAQAEERTPDGVGMSVRCTSPHAQSHNQRHTGLSDAGSSSAPDTHSSLHPSPIRPGNGLFESRSTSVQVSPPDSTLSNVHRTRKDQSPKRNGTALPLQCTDLVAGEQPADSGQPASSSPGSALDDEFPSWLTEVAVDFNALSYPFPIDLVPLEYGWQDLSSENTNTVIASNPDLEKIWFTRMHEQSVSQPMSGAMTPEQNQTQPEVDENYRRTLHTRLQMSAFDPALPSSDFFNLSIRSYFARFHPIYPVIHAATFQPSKKNSLLLLSICSIGSLFTGSAKGALRGAHIFEQLNKPSWQLGSG